MEGCSRFVVPTLHFWAQRHLVVCWGTLDTGGDLRKAQSLVGLVKTYLAPLNLRKMMGFRKIPVFFCSWDRRVKWVITNHHWQILLIYLFIHPNIHFTSIC